MLGNTGGLEREGESSEMSLMPEEEPRGRNCGGGGVRLLSSLKVSQKSVVNLPARNFFAVPCGSTLPHSCDLPSVDFDTFSTKIDWSVEAISLVYALNRKRTGVEQGQIMVPLISGFLLVR